MERRQSMPSKSIVSIQILRAIAALTVAISHFHHEFIQVPGGVSFGIGGFGVDLFFLISGFIMVYVCWDIFGQRGASMNFFLRRLARIGPLYWVASAIFLACVIETQTISQADLSNSSIIWSFLFIPMPRPSGNPYPMLSVGWTLNFEMLFYAIFALGLCFRRAKAIAFAVTVLVGIVALATFYRGGFPHPLRFWTNDLVLEFALGMLVAVLYKNGIRITRSLAVVLFASAATIVGVVYYTWAYGYPQGLPSYRAYVWGLGASLILVGAVLAPWKLEGRIAAALYALGDASFAIYILHPLIALWPPTLLSIHGILLPVTNWPYLVLLTGLTIAISLVVFRYLELPLTRWLYQIVDERFPVHPIGGFTPLSSTKNAPIVLNTGLLQAAGAGMAARGPQISAVRAGVPRKLVNPIGMLLLLLGIYMLFVLSVNVLREKSPEEKGLEYLLKARSLQQAMKYDDALLYFSKSLDESQNIGMPGLVYVERGTLYQTMGKIKEALEDYTRGIAINPHQSFLIRHALVAYALGKADMVAEDIKQLDVCCKDAAEVKQLSAQLAYAGSATNPGQATGETTGQSAKEAKAYQVLEIARQKRAEKRYEESVSLYSQVLQLAPYLGMPGLLYVERGDIYQTLGRSQEALDDYARAIDINPHQSFLIRHASVAYALGRTDLVAADIKHLEACCRDAVEVKQLVAQLASTRK